MDLHSILSEIDYEDFICHEIRYSLAIGPCGEIYPWLNFRKIIGYVYNGIENAWNSKDLKYIQNLKNKDLLKCNTCINQKFCVRCTGLAYLSKNNILECSPTDKMIAEVRRSLYNEKILNKVKGLIALRIIFNSLQSVTIAMLPIILTNFVNDFVVDGISSEKIAFYIIGYILMLVLGFIFSVLYNYFQFRMYTNIQIYIINDYFHSLLDIDLEIFSKTTIGEYISIDNNDLVESANYVEAIFDFIATGIQMVVYLVLTAVFISWIVSIILLVGCGLSFVISSRFDKSLSIKRNAYLLELGKYNENYKNLLSARLSINDSVKNNVFNHYSRVQERTMNKRMSYFRTKAVSLSVNGYAQYLPYLISFVICAILIKYGYISLGMFVGAISFVDSFTVSIECIQNDMSDIISLKEVKLRVIDSFEEMKRNNNRKEISSFSKIYFNDFGIKYDSDTILENVNFTIESGKKYVLLGKNGSGKSSILRCLVGENTGYDGNVCVDGEELRNINLHNNIWYVNQADFILNEDYMTTVSVFNSFDSSLAKRIDKEIKGYTDENFIQCDDCSTLSGGERQLLSFERALISGANIIILDEPFSAIDKKMLSKLYDFIAKLGDKYTIILISHDNVDNLLWADHLLEINNKTISVLK